MYDTQTFRLGGDKCRSVDLMAEVPNYLEKTIVSNTDDGNTFITGYNNQFKVVVTPNGVKLHKGSLCKSWHGNNIQTLGRQEAQWAIEQLSDELHLPIHDANVFRIDLAANFITKFSPVEYYPYLGPLQYYKRQPFGNGLYYNASKTSIIFYDKIKEQKAKTQIIPDIYQHANMLRYEMRFTKRLPKTFNVPELTASMLYDEDFYSSIISTWKDNYKSIKKIRQMTDDIQPTGSTKDLVNFLALAGLEKYGHIEAMDMIAKWQRRKDIDKKQAQDLRRKLRSLSDLPKYTNSSELIDELDQKIERTVEQYE